MKSHTIEIDLALHKAIEAERRSFEESPSEILHRLIADNNTRPKLNSDFSGVDKAWYGSGVELPHGTKLRMSYNGSQFTAEIVDGRWLVDGDFYSSPSAAAYGVARTREGSPANINGWIYWEALLPGEKTWVYLGDMRDQKN